MDPVISVVMPCHNARPYLDEAIRSILDQTLSEFELILLDDGSTDGTREDLREWSRRDERIRLLRNPERSGLSRSSARIVSEARAPLIARMDADDTSRPERLERQREVMSRRPDASLVATLWEGIDQKGRTVRSRDRWRLLKRRPFAPFTHGSIMFRRSAYDAVAGYRNETEYWEDFDFYLQMARVGRILVIPDALYHYRFHVDNSRLVHQREELERAYGLLHRCVAAYREEGTYESQLFFEQDAEQSPVDVRSYVTLLIGSTRLWAGCRPGIIHEVFSSWPASRLALQTLLIALWGQASPATLRFFLNLIVRIRDRIAGRHIQPGEVIEWVFESS